MVSGAGRRPTPAVPAFGPAALQVAVRVGCVGVRAGTGRGPPRPHPVDPGGHNGGIHPTSGLRVQVAGFGHHQAGDILADPAAGEQPEGFRQVEPQRPGGPQTTGAFVR